MPWRRRRSAPAVLTAAPPAACCRPDPSEHACDLRVTPPPDDLTGLGDRLGLKQRLEALVVLAATTDPRPALLLVDLDAFHQTNDRFGRVLGDEVLRVIGRRLVMTVEHHGTAFRAGGDEFIVLLDRTTQFDAVVMAGRLLAAVSEPLGPLGASICLSASVAVVMLGDRHRADSALRDADVTMYRAKLTGGNRVDVYSPDVEDWVRARKADVDVLEREVEELRVENQALAELTAIDPGSGLPNQASFDADHHQVRARRSRSGERYSVLLVEVDRLEECRHQPGRSTVNQILKAVGQSINTTVRDGDRAYRYGPDDFAVLLPGAELRHAVVAAERVRSRVEALALDHPTAGVVTVTVGAVEAGFRHSSAKDVLLEVEALTDQAKEVGGNRIAWPR